METFIIKLYKKFLYGNISRDEFLEMRYEINKTSDKELSTLLEEEWNDDLSVNKISEKDKAEINKNLNFYINYDTKRSNRKRYYQIAAVLIPCVVLLSVYLYTLQPQQENGNFVVEVKAGEKAQVTLPDHSRVWLNSKTKLTYTNGLVNAREVTLTGEAFFKVSKDKTRPFLVSMNNLQVEVLGTSFNVKATPGSDLIETSLVEGKVKLSGVNLSQDYYLKPNEKAIYSNSSKNIQIVSTDNELETAWKDNKLKFNSEPFKNVITRIEDWYGVKITCNCPKIENDPISGTFNNEQLTEVLENFKILYHIKYEMKDENIIITSK